MTSKVTLRAIDNENQLGSATFPVADAVLDADLTALRTAVNNVTLGNDFGHSLVTEIEKTALNNANPGNGEVDRGKKFLVRIEVQSTPKKIATRTIPNADFSLVGTDGKVDITAGAGLALKTAIETVFNDNGDSGVVLDILKATYAS